ncbi:MAG: hypothetical protein ABIK31_07490 [candidate division WOR-3 bacterium]
MKEINSADKKRQNEKEGIKIQTLKFKYYQNYTITKENRIHHIFKTIESVIKNTKPKLMNRILFLCLSIDIARKFRRINEGHG